MVIGGSDQISDSGTLAYQSDVRNALRLTFATFDIYIEAMHYQG
jgi:hypothetical protein